MTNETEQSDLKQSNNQLPDLEQHRSFTLKNTLRSVGMFLTAVGLVNFATSAALNLVELHENAHNSANSGVTTMVMGSLALFLSNVIKPQNEQN